MPTTTSSGSSAAITARSFANPASVAARSTAGTGRATVPVGSETATPAGDSTLTLPSRVGELARGAAPRAGHLRDEDLVLLVLPEDLGAGRLRLRLLRLALQELDLGAHRLELLRAPFEHRPSLAGGHR